MSTVLIWYCLSSSLLAAALFFPVRTLITNLAARRLQRKNQRPLTPEEIQGQKRRAGFLSLFIALGFAFLFNAALFPTTVFKAMP